MSAAALEGLFLYLRRLGDLKMHVVETIAAGLAAGVVYLVALYFMERAEERRAMLWIVLAAAVAFRLTLAPLQPSLSDDLYRYRWDGII